MLHRGLSERAVIIMTVIMLFVTASGTAVKARPGDIIRRWTAYSETTKSSLTVSVLRLSDTDTIDRYKNTSVRIKRPKHVSFVSLILTCSCLSMHRLWLSMKDVRCKTASKSNITLCTLAIDRQNQPCR